ncbi:MAG TPA: hypothetical protein VKU00_08330 [Chthonomonadaceae bacterium]|nr:hypothetical protein [Chthonomonadaceae bacterium]
MESTEFTPWHPNEAIFVPKNASSAMQIAPLAKQLRQPDIKKVVTAFDAGLYDLAVEYVWKRTMSILKRQLSTMGMSFVGEMLARPDIVDESPAELVITDYEAIQLAYQLGIVSRIGSIELRHHAELLSYYSSPDVEEDEEIDYVQALTLLRGCVVHILSREKIETALDFKKLRQKLTQQVLPKDDSDIIYLVAAPYFWKRTTLRVLLAEAKTAKGAQVENALGNLNTIITMTWQGLQDPDRWQIGQSYAEASSNNHKVLSSTLRRILMTVQGFDYVPETLRSSSYAHAATEVLSAHEQANNFYNEPAPMKALASLGSIVPGPAFQICMRATLAVKLGNRYGYCFDAQPYADKMLDSLSQDRWTVYLYKFLPSDEMILSKLTLDAPSQRWTEIVQKYPYDTENIGDQRIINLLKVASQGDAKAVRTWAKALYRDLGA